MDPLIGQIEIFGGNFAPRGWAFCNGQLLAISSNNALFSILGTIYGGDGRTTFALPDLRSRAPLHVQSYAGYGLSARRLGERGGRETITLSTSNLPIHTHTVQVQNASIATSSSAATESEPDSNFILGAATIYSDRAPDGTIGTVTVPSSTTSSEGASSPVDNMPPFLAVNYIIALMGVYPSRG